MNVCAGKLLKWLSSQPWANRPDHLKTLSKLNVYPQFLVSSTHIQQFISWRTHVIVITEKYCEIRKIDLTLPYYLHSRVITECIWCMCDSLLTSLAHTMFPLWAASFSDPASKLWSWLQRTFHSKTPSQAYEVAVITPLPSTEPMTN